MSCPPASGVPDLGKTRMIRDILYIIDESGPDGVDHLLDLVVPYFRSIGTSLQIDWLIWLLATKKPPDTRRPMHSRMPLHRGRKAGWNAGLSGCSLGDDSRACLQSATIEAGIWEHTLSSKVDQVLDL